MKDFSFPCKPFTVASLNIAHLFTAGTVSGISHCTNANQLNTVKQASLPVRICETLDSCWTPCGGASYFHERLQPRSYSRAEFSLPAVRHMNHSLSSINSWDVHMCPSASSASMTNYLSPQFQYQLQGMWSASRMWKRGWENRLRLFWQTCVSNKKRSRNRYFSSLGIIPHVSQHCSNLSFHYGLQRSAVCVAWIVPYQNQIRFCNIFTSPLKKHLAVLASSLSSCEGQHWQNLKHGVPGVLFTVRRAVWWQSARPQDDVFVCVSLSLTFSLNAVVCWEVTFSAAVHIQTHTQRHSLADSSCFYR